MDKQNIVNKDKNRTKGLLIKMRRHKLLSGMISAPGMGVVSRVKVLKVNS